MRSSSRTRLAIGLTLIGVYAVVAYVLSERHVEIGVRVALGGTPRRVVAGMVGQTLGVISTGIGVRWLLAVLVDRDVLGHPSLDPVAFAGVPLVLLLVSTAACAVPARRAARVDPTIALHLN